MKRLDLDQRVAALAVLLLVAAVLLGGLSGCAGGGDATATSGPDATIQPVHCAASSACAS